MDLDTISVLRELPYCTCNDEPFPVRGTHRASCPSQWSDDVIAEIERLKAEADDWQWAVRNGERYFGSLYKKTTLADIRAIRKIVTDSAKGDEHE